jgi:hypothetical protein
VNTFARCSANSIVLSSSLLAHFGLGAVSSLIGGTCCLGFFRCLIGFQIVLSNLLKLVIYSWNDLSFSSLILIFTD